MSPVKIDWPDLHHYGYKYQESIQQVMLSNDFNAFGPDELLSAFEARVRNIDEPYGLLTLSTTKAIHFTVNGIYQQHQSIRVVIHAKDVSLSLTAPSNSSILNVVAGHVLAINSSHGFVCMVTVQVGGDQLMSLISKKSAANLQLKTNQKVFLQIKTNAIHSNVLV